MQNLIDYYRVNVSITAAYNALSGKPPACFYLALITFLHQQ